MSVARANAGLALLALILGLSACGGEDDGGKGRGHLMKQTLPAEIDEHPDGFGSAAVMHPLENAWRTSSHRRFTQVEAGGLAADNSDGAFTIFRHEFVSANQNASVVKVLGSGPLRITHAPLGARVEESSQEDGKIHFVGTEGVRGVLHLNDDSVTLFPPRSP